MLSAICIQRDWWLRLCTLAAFVLSISSARTAFAAAPMCGMHAQTIAAPLIGMPGSTAALKAARPCEDSAPLRAAGVPNREAPEKLSLPDLQVRALPLLAWLSSSPLSTRLGAAPPDQELLATGFPRSIYRPPRA